MRSTLLTLSALVMLALALACDDNPTQPQPAKGFDSYVHFDGPSFLWTKFAHPGHAMPGEWVLNWENSLGEPFEDINANGVYNPEVDNFTVCACPDNQDLNHNGRYDSPAEPWTPGVPFDDIDSSGTYRPYPFDLLYYEQDLPFADFNGNGVHDSTLPYAYYMLRRELVPLGDTAQRVEFWHEDEYFQFVSDSGVDYRLPAPLGAPIQSQLWFVVTADRVSVHPEYYEDDLLFPLIERSTVRDHDTTLIYPVAGADTLYSYERHIEAGDSLVIGGTTHRDLLHVSLLRSSPESGSYDYDYYFATALGLLAIRISPTEHGLEDWLYFDTRFSQLPVPLTR